MPELLVTRFNCLECDFDKSVDILIASRKDLKIARERATQAFEAQKHTHEIERTEKIEEYLHA